MTVTSYQTIDRQQYKETEGRKRRKNKKRERIASKNRSSLQQTTIELRKQNGIDKIVVAQFRSK
jgi:hypothetical protein